MKFLNGLCKRDGIIRVIMLCYEKKKTETIKRRCEKIRIKHKQKTKKKERNNISVMYLYDLCINGGGWDVMNVIFFYYYYLYRSRNILLY